MLYRPTFGNVSKLARPNGNHLAIVYFIRLIETTTNHVNHSHHVEPRLKSPCDVLCCGMPNLDVSWLLSTFPNYIVLYILLLLFFENILQLQMRSYSKIYGAVTDVGLHVE